MTMIAGLICADGLLMCSDREESGGPVKSSTRKLFDISCGQFQFAIATAGDAALCDKAVAAIETAARAATFAALHEEAIEDLLREIHTTYIWAKDVPGHERGLELILASYDASNQQAQLYRSCEEMLQPCRDFVVAGSGSDLASYFLERLFSRTMSLAEAESLMTFIMREVKDSSEGCGRESEMLALTTSGAARSLAGDADLPRLAELLRPFWKGTAKPAGRKARVSK